MEEYVCSKEAKYFCEICIVGLCKHHKRLHEEDIRMFHSFKNLGKRIPPQKILKLSENLLSKINFSNECEKRIIDET